MRRKIIHLCILTVSLSAITGWFYWHYEQFSRTMIRDHHFDHEKANAAKHAYAAAQIFTVIAPVAGDATAEKMVLFLGNANERFEQIVDRFTADSVAEIVKDIYNNQAGIAAAIWYDSHASSSRILLRDTVIYLADSNMLINKEAGAIITPYYISLKRQQAVSTAIKQVEKERPRIIDQVRAALDTMPDHQR